MRTICVCERGRMMIYGRDCFSADEGGHRARREGADERPGGGGQCESFGWPPSQ